MVKIGDNVIVRFQLFGETRYDLGVITHPSNTNSVNATMFYNNMNWFDSREKHNVTIKDIYREDIDSVDAIFPLLIFLLFATKGYMNERNLHAIISPSMYPSISLEYIKEILTHRDYEIGLPKLEKLLGHMDEEYEAEIGDVVNAETDEERLIHSHIADAYKDYTNTIKQFFDEQAARWKKMTTKQLKQNLTRSKRYSSAMHSKIISEQIKNSFNTIMGKASGVKKKKTRKRKKYYKRKPKK